VSFFGDLFNFRFERFIYVRVAKALYLFALLISALFLIYYEVSLIISFNRGYAEEVAYWDNYFLTQDFWSFVTLVVGLPLLYLLEIIALRLVLETGVALIKIAENTSKQ
jgi:hypothetical protein